MTQSWSEQFAARYQLRLPADLCAWLDDEVWKDAGGAEFCQPLDPKQLIDPPPGSIWSGFMLPDTLPFVGNQYGDWLSLRIGGDGSISEVLYWSHGGGDWMPYGRTLAEALLYDSAFHVIYPRRPEFVGPEPPRHQLFRLARWAAHWIGSQELPPFWDDPAVDPLEALQRAGICDVAVCRDRIVRSLESRLNAASHPGLARQLGASWEPEFVRWVFDNSLVPERTQESIARHFDAPFAHLSVQDWEAAEQQAIQVATLRQDLAWSLDIAGWAAERRGDAQLAAERYWAGLPASLFADESIRFRTHWFEEGFGKFSAARLARLKECLTDEQRNDPYLNLFWKNDPESLRSRVRDYWLGQAAEATRAGDHQRAYRCHYNAGWDLGLQYVKSYDDILQGLARSARAAGWEALARIAEKHLRCLLP